MHLLAGTAKGAHNSEKDAHVIPNDKSAFWRSVRCHTSPIPLTRNTATPPLKGLHKAHLLSDPVRLPLAASAANGPWVGACEWESWRLRLGKRATCLEAPRPAVARTTLVIDFKVSWAVTMRSANPVRPRLPTRIVPMDVNSFHSPCTT